MKSPVAVPNPEGEHRCDPGPPRLSPPQMEVLSRLILDHTPDCIKLLDENARVSWVSAPGCRLLEIDDPAQLIGSPWLELWPESARPDVAAAVEAARTGGIGRFTHRCRTFKGTPKWWHVIVTAIRTPDDQPMLLSLSRDVTELVALIDNERALAVRAEAARDAADRATAQKDELLATVSHELRVPLNIVLSWSVMLQAESSDPAAVKVARRIERATTEQILLIEQLLEDHRLDHTTAIAAVEAVDVHQVVAEAMAVVHPEAERRRQLLTLHAGDADCDDRYVAGDSRRLRQVLVNLLWNAAKFTPDGGRITVRVQPDPAGCRIMVSDTGVGIGPAFIDHIFDRYSQEDRPAVRNEKGLGLGLHIAKRLVEMHGGTIEAESAGPDTGAAFTIVLPTIDAQARRSGPSRGSRSGSDLRPHAPAASRPTAGAN